MAKKVLSANRLSASNLIKNITVTQAEMRLKLRQKSLSPSPKSRKNPIVRIEKKQRAPFKSYIVPGFAVITGGMVCAAATQLIDPNGFTGVIKIGLLSLGAGLVSYVVNRYAIEEGAELAATGFLTAGIVSVGSILIVGGGLFASTYSGLTLKPLNELHLQEHGTALSRYVEAHNKWATEALRTMPVIDAAQKDIQLHVDCELNESCLSGRGRGGRGRVTRALEPVAKRAEEIASQLKLGEEQRTKRLGAINKLLSSYRTTLGNHNDGIHERRSKLLRLDTAVKQAVSELRESLPLSLLSSYSDELNTGITIAKRPTATENINRLLHRHGASLKAALDSFKSEKIDEPEFPSEAGVSTTFAYIGRFFSIAALTACVELIMPLTLWIYTYLSLVWSKYQAHPPSYAASAKEEKTPRRQTTQRRVAARSPRQTKKKEE